MSHEHRWDIGCSHLYCRGCNRVVDLLGKEHTTSANRLKSMVRAGITPREAFEEQVQALED